MPRPSNRRPNLLAFGISLSAIGILYAATHQGASDAVASEHDSILLSLPAPIGDQIDPVTGVIVATGDKATVDEPGNPESAETTKIAISGRTAMLLQVLMLEKGQAQFRELQGYGVTFLKRERIDGSLGEMQHISLDVRHEPFSVYMKWKNYDKGRQLLFVPEENDGMAHVRLGGFKGRLLGAMKIAPDGPKAMAESRYPITEAGVLPIVRKMLEYRRADLKKTGVTCQFDENAEMYNRKCYRFDMHYDSPEACKLYRHCIAYLDQETLIPIRVCNYTWAVDAGEMSAKDLQELTLIEDYGFSDLKVKSEQVAVETFKNRKL